MVETLELKEAILAEKYWKVPWWDPVPPWLKLDEARLHRFAALEVQFKIKELQMQQEKLEEFSRMLG